MGGQISVSPTKQRETSLFLCSLPLMSSILTLLPLFWYVLIVCV